MDLIESQTLVPSLLPPMRRKQRPSKSTTETSKFIYHSDGEEDEVERAGREQQEKIWDGMLKLRSLDVQMSQNLEERDEREQERNGDLTEQGKDGSKPKEQKREP
ncbi:hypothetical protein B0T21DRAFT_453288 [Apiosordaria backusii]|uniref:Uncharacterized protein n=1 Tax=Apiosordaria backusii TaxID=314023 RepID=A0AA40E4F8_9PEZI|nr:hypothetical protein B0T21DRAFT_453288 [Apiosordaria backusii]